MSRYLLLLLCLCAAAGDAAARPSDKTGKKTGAPKEAAEIEADTLTYQPKQSKMTAAGNVRVVFKNRKLLAERAVYDQTRNVITAKGNVQAIDEHGNQFFADDATFDDKLTHGEVNRLSGRMIDDSRFAATRGVKENPDVYRLENAVYSPCKVCKQREKQDPLWQVTAGEATVDNAAERMFYRDVTFDIYGVPVFYTPYFSHPTPSARRKSGFLIPEYTSSSTLGLMVGVPYYWDIAPNMDMTVKPTLTSQESALLAGEFRHLTSGGRYELQGSVTNPRERDEFGNRTHGHDLRGHIEGRGRFDLADRWSWGFDGKRASDDTYLQRYRFGYEDLLTSRLFTEKIDRRNYVGIQGVSFQGLNATDDPDTTPLVLPLAETHFEKAAGFRNSRWLLDGSALALTRDDGVDTRRLSAAAGWVLPHVTPGGHLFELKASLRGDIYSVNNFVVGGREKDGPIGRMIPEAQASWSFPLARRDAAFRTVIEPVADLIVSPLGSNPNKIPNEDSQGLELSDTNLFSSNHFTGLDRVEGGPRANYGIRGSLSHDDLGSMNFLFGQNYRATIDENFTEKSGLDSNFSDYVGRVSVTDDENAELAYRFRLDKKDLILRRNEVETAVKFDPLRVSAGYILLDERDESFDRQEAVADAALKLTDGWSLTAGGRHDLDRDGGWVNSNAGVNYENECIRLQLGWNRDFIRDRDIEPSISYTVQVSFKNLGRSDAWERK